MRRCQRCPARGGLAVAEGAEGDVVAKGDAVQERLPGRGQARGRGPATGLHDLVAAGDEAPNRLDREEVAGTGHEAGPAGAAERGGVAGPVGDPGATVVVPEAPELVQCLLGPPRVADDPESATLAAPDRDPESAGRASQPNSGSPHAGQGGFSGPAPASSGTTGVRCASLMRGSVRPRRGSVPEPTRGPECRASKTIAWEARWATPVALATFLAVALIISPSFFSEVSGAGDAAVLRSTDAHGGSVALAGVLQGLGFALLALPLVYLFRVVRARSPRVLSQLIGLVVIAPLFLALSTGLSGFARGEAADQFVAGEAKSTLSPKEARQECRLRP